MPDEQPMPPERTGEPAWYRRAILAADVIFWAGAIASMLLPFAIGWIYYTPGAEPAGETVALAKVAFWLGLPAGSFIGAAVLSKFIAFVARRMLARKRGGEIVDREIQAAAARAEAMAARRPEWPLMRWGPK